MDNITSINPETTGQRVKWLRKKRGISRSELASAAEMRYSSLADLESDRSKSSANIYKISTVLNCRVEWLETGLGQIDRPEASRYGTPDPEILRDVFEVMLEVIERKQRSIETLIDPELISFTYDLLLRERALKATTLNETKRKPPSPAFGETGVVLTFKKILSGLAAGT